MATDSSHADDRNTTIEEIERRIDEQFQSSFDEPLRSKGWVQLAIYALAVAFFAYHMWYGYTSELPRSRHGIIHLALVLALWGLLKLAAVDTSDWRGKALAVAYGAYSVAAVVPLYYMNSNYRSLVMRAGSYSGTDIAMGALLIVLVLVALASVSRLITGIAAFGLIYSYFGPLMPGIFRHRGLSPNRIVTMNTVELQGLLGTLLQISATWVVIFLILAGLMEKYGGMAAFIKGVTRVAARSRYVEIGQVAVAASAFMGSINGSTAANTATTGAFTIPLMKENGYSPRLAAAIESVASCGGQILPPVMGAGAFLMAELIDPTYSEIIIGAAVPAVLFFLTVAVSISLNSRRTVTQEHIEISDERSVGERLSALVSHYEYIGMFAVLLYWLIYVQADPMVAGFYSIVTLVGLRFVRRMTGDEPLRERLRLFGRETLSGLHRGAEATVDITILLASLGIVIRALIVTGFAQQLSTQIILVAGGSLAVLLVLVMFSSIAFGMGMSTTAAYMLVAILVAPSLLDTGLEPLVGHLYVFYFAIVSNITPPIALSVVIAQGIAGSDYLETAVEALKIGFPMFLLPYAFVFNQALVFPGPLTLIAFTVVLVGFVAISASLAGRLTRPLSLPVRLGLFAAGLSLLFAPLGVQGVLAALVFGALVYVSRGEFGLRTVVD
ncbi:TRAP transporter permease [Halegenticoccus soli]|uniref:TRAP transporter permease n=1 Tax=Halegenticoccus soli TaxID=1985678 RepID=UPI000C6CB883|nr:TRAP transporter fused permease subunit [Halegenticoccus soli]